MLWLATGGNQAAREMAEQLGQAIPAELPIPYRLLSFVPGLTLIRGPAWLAGGVHLILCMLAGLGLARLLRLVPPARQLERLRDGWGILLDDVAAAVYANVIGQIVFRWVIPTGA